MKKYVWLIKAPEDNRDPYLTNMCKDQLKKIERELGSELEFTEDFDVFAAQPLRLFYIGSGGSEMLFRAVYDKVEGPYYLLTQRAHNSLAASMEILSFLGEQGRSGEILHGDPDELARRIRILMRAVETKEKLKGMRLGVTGESDWLIGAPVDGELLRERSGMELVHVPMSEIFAEWEKHTHEDNEWTLRLKGMGYDKDEMERALNVYGACRRIVDRYALDAITLRCFDLLEPTCITGCLALGILNAEGIWAACEGDSRSLVSMVVIGELTGQPVFMANPSRLYHAKKEIVFAHCILPLDMTEKYKLTTHFESGLGISVAADLPADACTVFKCREDFETYLAADGRIITSMHEGNLCRTQISLEIPKGLDYFTTKPIANHHMIVLGNYEELVDEFYRLF